MKYLLSKYTALIITMLKLFSNEIYAEEYPKIDFNGYIYNLPTIQFLNDDNKMLFNNSVEKDYFLSNITRFRIRPELNFNSNSRITMHYEINSIISDLNFNVFQTGKTNRQAVDMNWNIANEENFIANHFIDRFYYKHTFDAFEFAIGRQRIAWGVGRIWQPTDLFNPINPANFSQFEKPGADAVSFKYFFGLFTDLELVFNFIDSWNNSNFGGRFRTNYKEFDISLMTGQFDQNYVIGADFAGNIKGAGIRGEALYNLNENSDNPDFVRLILGVDYQFNSELYGLIEYQFNGEGKTVLSEYELLRLFNGEILNVNQNYLAIQAAYQINPLWNASIMYNANLNDGSGFANASIDYNVLQNINLSLSSIYFYGNERTEYSYFPTAVFMNIQYYFGL